MVKIGYIYMIVGALLLVGCKTKSVVEIVEVHDTLRVHSTDTVKDVRVTVRHDTIRLTDYIKVTIRESGETIRVDRWRDRWKTVEVHDTVDRYKSKADSLQAVVEKMKTKEVTKTPWFWKWGWKVLALAVLVLGIVLTHPFPPKGRGNG